MKSQIWIISAFIVIAITAIILAKPGKNLDNLKTQNPEEKTETVDDNEYSLTSFSKRDFEGIDFQVGRQLESHTAYNRYFITYKSNGLTISGIMNRPHGDGPFPLLILNHGHIDTSVYTNGRGLRREQDYFARNGYVVVHPDYRNHAQSDKDATTDGGDFRFNYTTDVINAVKALQASRLPYVDTSRIGMLGHSMGGGITQNILVTHPTLIDAAVLYAPVSADVRDNFNKWTRPRKEISDKILETYGEPDANPKFWDNISPVNFIDKIKVPVMIHHGTNDKDTDIEWSKRLVEALEAANKSITFHIYEGQPHEFTSSWGTFMQRSLEFFNQNLKS